MNEGENFVLCTIRRRVFKTHTHKKTLSKKKKSSKQNKKKERKISVYGTEEEDPEGETVEDGGRTMAEQIKASVSKSVDKVKLM